MSTGERDTSSPGPLTAAHRRKKRRAALMRRLFSTRLFRPRPGHFYSPIPSIKDITRDADRIFDRSLRALPGIAMDVDGQREMVRALAGFYAEQPFADTARDGRRYFFDNFYYAGADAIFLYAMLRVMQPRRIVEIGSGFSSAVMLDTNELFFDNAMRLTFIEPNSARLRSLLKDADRRTVEIIEKRIQDVGPDVVDTLGRGDILFVDSSHVSKVGSDVNYILFELLPRLAPGVIVHFHDIPYPFEYPREWYAYGYCWNEPYLLRAFLQHNSAFTIVLWNDFVIRFHKDLIEATMPICALPIEFGVGGSIWLQRNPQK
jgi:predicted O-methyltransferase YrrM